MTASDVAASNVALPNATSEGAFESHALELDPSETEAFEPDVENEDGAPDVGRPSHLRVAPKVPRDLLRRRRRARFALLGVAAISAASMFTLVAFHVFAVQSAFQLDKLQGELSTERRHNEALRGQVAAFSSPGAVAHAAEHLGMVRSPKVTLLHAPDAASFGAAANLSIPPATPYRSIAAGP